ncbi:MAG: hypothetical protein Q7J44_16765 [Pseudotabrizicola sp.]|uniref:hypothetical protein n=1 Tax=Pseudotabrizicola sp. TaxID=2939647 RepID=UPI002723F2A4|nr:hypothetical protein [Pseudotabrizicola sp.]MDO9640191.1 hypothetical protein [Pseudotabrizicola sp.]
MNYVAVSSYATVAATLVASAGFYLTVCQISATRLQLQAANEYAIRADAREMAATLSDRLFASCLNGAPDCTESDRRRTLVGLGLGFNFYHSVYQHARGGSLSDRFEDEMARDFCSWFSFKSVQDFWDLQVNAKKYGAERIKMKQSWCSPE